VRLVPLLIVALLFAACGSAEERTGVPASSEVESMPAETTTAPPMPAADGELKPPAIVLVFRTEEQVGARGSYCVDYVDEASGQGQGMCADAALPTYPEAVTAVGPGDRVTFVIRESVARRDSVVTIRPLGCSEQTLGELRFKPGHGELRWDVDLKPGAYQLDVFARFKALDGRSGDVSAVLGLTVAGPKKWDALGVLDVKRSLQVCPFEG